MYRQLVFLILILFSASTVTGEKISGAKTLTIKASTLGLGLEASHSFQSLRLRFGGHFFNLKTDQTIGKIDYEIEADLRYASLLLDWHPSPGNFFASAGLLYNADEIIARSLDATSYLIGGHYYPMGETGYIIADVQYPTLAPYLGLGWEGKFSSSGSLHWIVELGVAYLGKNNVIMETQHTPTGLPGSDQWENDLTQEALVLEDYFDKFRFLPVVSLGLSYSL